MNQDMNMNDDNAGASPRRARRRVARAEEILDASAELLVADGFDAFTMQRLAARLDYATGAVYRYFPSKDAIVAELQRRTVQRLRERLQARLAALNAASAGARGVRAEAVRALAPLFAVTDVYRAVARERDPGFESIAQTLTDPRERLDTAEARRVIEAALPLFAQIRGLFDGAAGARALTRGDGMERALILWSSLHAALQLRKLARIDAALFDAERLADAAVRTLFLGWGADPRALERAAAAAARAGR
jgi:AcrR family transcriptional regulator